MTLGLIILAVVIVVALLSPTLTAQKSVPVPDIDRDVTSIRNAMKVAGIEEQEKFRQRHPRPEPLDKG